MSKRRGARRAYSRACLPQPHLHNATHAPQDAARWARYDDKDVKFGSRAEALRDCECDGYLFFYVNPMQQRASGL